MSPTRIPSITVRFRWWAMPFFLGSLKVIEAAHFLGILSAVQGGQAAEFLGGWTVAHGVKVE